MLSDVLMEIDDKIKNILKVSFIIASEAFKKIMG